MVTTNLWKDEVKTRLQIENHLITFNLQDRISINPDVAITNFQLIQDVIGGGVARHDRVCTLYTKDKLGDQFHHHLSVHQWP